MTEFEACRDCNTYHPPGEHFGAPDHRYQCLACRKVWTSPVLRSKIVCDNCASSAVAIDWPAGAVEAFLTEVKGQAIEDEKLAQQRATMPVWKPTSEWDAAMADMQKSIDALKKLGSEKK